MVEEHIAAGSGSTYFFTSLLDCPGFGPEHVELMRYIGLGGSPIPNAVAERADELGISLVRSYGCTEHPSVTGPARRDPKEKRIHTDGRPLDWVEIRTVDEDGQRRRRRASPARSSPGARTASPATPTRP